MAVVYDVKINNNSGKRVELSYGFSINGTSSASDCDVDENRQMGMNGLGLSYGTDVTLQLKNGDVDIIQIGGWKSENEEPRWSINIIRFPSANEGNELSSGQKNTGQQNKLGNSNSNKGAYKLNQSNDDVNAGQQERLNALKRDQEMKRERQPAAYKILKAKSAQDKANQSNGINSAAKSNLCFVKHKATYYAFFLVTDFDAKISYLSEPFGYEYDNNGKLLHYREMKQCFIDKLASQGAEIPFAPSQEFTNTRYVWLTNNGWNFKLSSIEQAKEKMQAEIQMKGASGIRAVVIDLF